MKVIYFKREGFLENLAIITENGLILKTNSLVWADTNTVREIKHKFFKFARSVGATNVDKIESELNG